MLYDVNCVLEIHSPNLPPLPPFCCTCVVNHPHLCCCPLCISLSSSSSSNFAMMPFNLNRLRASRTAFTTSASSSVSDLYPSDINYHLASPLHTSVSPNDPYDGYSDLAFSSTLSLPCGNPATRPAQPSPRRDFSGRLRQKTRAVFEAAKGSTTLSWHKVRAMV